MDNQRLIDELGARIRAMMAGTPAQDFETNLRAMLASAFAKLDLVTREEFDVQAAVLARTREKLGRLEARLAEFEQRSGKSG